ncbi:MAG: hypothetical protein AAF063_36250 [Cyanobacteria bacterium J06643_5]
MNQTKLATLEGEIEPRKNQNRKTKQEPEIKEIVEARGWVRTPKGEIILVPYSPENTNLQAFNKSENCRGKANRVN